MLVKSNIWLALMSGCAECQIYHASDIVEAKYVYSVGKAHDVQSAVEECAHS